MKFCYDVIKIRMWLISAKFAELSMHCAYLQGKRKNRD